MRAGLPPFPSGGRLAMTEPCASIIFLNGPSSSGKTTLGRSLQSIMDEPFLYFSSDQLVSANVLPEMDREGRGGIWSWKDIRPRFFKAFHHCIEAFAQAGNNLIIEHVLEFRSWYEECVGLLAPYDSFFVGVHCPMEELERRERLRGDRKIGEGRSHIQDGVHSWGPYDFEIDTSLLDPGRNAQLVKDAFIRRNKIGAFKIEHGNLGIK